MLSILKNKNFLVGDDTMLSLAQRPGGHKTAVDMVLLLRDLKSAPLLLEDLKAQI